MVKPQDLTCTHTEGLFGKRTDIKDISKLGKWAFPLPAALGETDNKSNNKSLFPRFRQRERAQHIFTSPLVFEFDHERVDTLSGIHNILRAGTRAGTHRISQRKAAHRDKVSET